MLVALKSLWRHVTPSADKGLGDRIDELARHAEIAKLNVAPRVHQNIARLHIAVDDVVVFLAHRFV